MKVNVGKEMGGVDQRNDCVVLNVCVCGGGVGVVTWEPVR